MKKIGKRQIKRSCPAKNKDSINLKKAGIVTGAIVGGVVGGGISVAGRLMKKPFVEEIGEGVASSGVLTGEIAGNAVSGTAHLLGGAITHKPHTAQKGAFELKKTGSQIVGNVTGNIKTVVNEGGNIAAAAKNRDADGVKKGVRKLGKMLAVQLLTVGALDTEEKSKPDSSEKI